MAEERQAYKQKELAEREAQQRKREERKRQNQLELERIRVERQRRAAEHEELKKIAMQNPNLQQAVADRENSMYKKARETRPGDNQDNLTTIQKMAWNAHDKIFGLAADIGQGKA